MDNCSIYSHQADVDKVAAILRRVLPKAKITEQGLAPNKTLRAVLKEGFFSKAKTLSLNYRQRENPSYTLREVEDDMTQNLAGMVNFIQSLPADNEVLRSKFVFKVMATNSEIGFIAEPGYNEDFEAVLKALVQELDAFVFVQPGPLFSASEVQYFADKDFNLIMDTAGTCGNQDIDVQVDAIYHDQPLAEVTEEQKERKARTESFLQEKGINFNKNLPCVESSEDARIRSKEEVIERVYALLLTAAKGQGAGQEVVKQYFTEKWVTGLSPEEKLIYEAAALDEQSKVNASWRQESMRALVWALGGVAELEYPGEDYDVEQFIHSLTKTTREEFEQSASLRPVAELLDELDKIYRLHWACVDARINGREAPAGLHPGVVYERHYALKWLTCSSDADWDDVTTDT